MTPYDGRRAPWAWAAMSAAALLAVYVVAVWTVAGQVVDTRLMRAAAVVLDDASWTGALLDLVSPATVLAALCFAVAAALALQGARAAATVGGTVVATLVGSELLKHLLVRPAWLDDAGNSLPSGHVSAVAALAVAAYVAVPGAARGLTATAGLVAVGATGLATMALGWHRPSDVVASALLAVGVGAVAAAVASSPGEPVDLSRRPGAPGWSAPPAASRTPGRR